MIQLLRRTGRPVGVAVVTLLLVAGGAFAGNAILGGGRADGSAGLPTGLSAPEPSETPDASEAPEATDAAETAVPEPTEAPEATDASEPTRAPETTEAAGAGDDHGLASAEPGAEQGNEDQGQTAEPGDDHLVAGTPEPLESSTDTGGGGTGGGDVGSSPGHD